MAAQQIGGLRRTGECQHITGLQRIEHPVRRADEQLQGTGRQQLTVGNQPDTLLSQITGRGRRLEDTRHPGQKRRCEFLQHAPHRKIEGIDMHRHAGAGDQHMSAGKSATFAQRHHRSLVPDLPGR